MPDIKEKVLERLRKEIEENNEEADVRLLKKGEEGLTRDVLTTLERSFGSLANLAEGEYFFVDKEEIGIDLFMVRLHVASDVPPENGAALCLIESLKNAELLGGSFGYDPDTGELSYNYGVPVSEGATEEQLYSLAGSAIATALSEARQHAGELLDVAGL